jgi:hypothetical protein
MLAVCTWKWGTRFSALHVNVLRAALAQRLHLNHRLFCVTDDPVGLDGDITVVEPPERLASGDLRCRRRMRQYDRDWSAQFGSRMLAIDLDVVLVDDITPIVKRPEPLVGWRVGHAGVYSGSFILLDVGALHGAWTDYRDDPEGFPAVAWPGGIGSDQAMINYWLRSQPPIPHWTERDGFVSYYGKGYSRLEHLGVGPSHPHLPAGARIVVLGSADLEVLHDARYPWIQEHWLPLAAAAGGCR